LAFSPVNASQAGYHQHHDRQTGKMVELDAQLDDVSPAGMAHQETFYKSWQSRLRKEFPKSTLNPEDAADWQMMDDQISQNLLEFERIQSYRHNPTVYVELIGNALFLPLTQDYASEEVRLGHVLSRMEQIPRLLQQAREELTDADPIFIQVAVEENDGNVGLIESTVQQKLAEHPGLKQRFAAAAPQAIAALKAFSEWMQQELSKRKTDRTWRLGKALYDEKFKYVMETDVSPEQVLADAERDLQAVRAEMLQLAQPMHREMYPGHGDHAELAAQARENKIIGEVLQRISDDHPQRDQLQAAVEKDLDKITQFIRDHHIVSLTARENLKVIPTPVFLRGIYSVAGFHAAPPLEATAEAEYWVTPVDPKMPAEKAESKLREYNNWVLQWLTIHEALPGHYVQAEHANNIQPETRRVLRFLFANGAYVEGWAEYIAQVMMDEGFLNNDPRFRLSMRKIRLRVLANAILDVRMQTMDMTDEQAMDLMTNLAFQTQAEAEGKLRRAKLSSAQLPTYYVGIRGWWDVRNQYQKAKGAKFNLQGFHDRALDEGPLPLPVLEKILLP
jgi:uncharacterized protein (DUF885 family)